MAAWQDVFTAVMVMNWPLMINLYLNATLVSPDIWAQPPFSVDRGHPAARKHVDYTERCRKKQQIRR